MNKGRIVVQNGPLKGREYEIAGKLTVGRSATNMVNLSDTEASRSHAEIVCQGEAFVLRDLKSSNGTKINGVPITEKALADGDVITIGETRLKFSLGRPKAFVVIFEKDSEAKPVAEVSSSSQTIFDTTPERTDINALKQMAKHYQRLCEANRIIASETDPNKVFQRILDQLFETFPADRALIMVLEKGTGDLITKAVRARNPEVDSAEIRISRTIVNRVISEGVSLVTSDASQDERLRSSQSVLAEEIRSAMCAPLVAQDTVMGIIYMDTKGKKNAFGETDLKLLTGIAGPAAIAIRNAQYMEMLGFVTHEMKGPLSTVLANLDVLRNGLIGDLTEKQKEVLSSIRENVEHFAEMIKNHLELAEIGDGEPPLKETKMGLRLDAGI